AGLAIARQREVETEMLARKQAEEAVRQSEQQVRRDLADMSLLQDLSRRLVKTGDLRALLEQVLDVAIAITHAEHVSVQLFESASGALNINSQRGQKHFLPFFVDVRQDVPLAGLAVEGGERVVVPDVLSSEVFAGSATQKSMLDGGVCAVVTPLLNRSGQTMGVISTQFGEAYQPGVREVQLLDLLARQAVDFIERSRAEEMLR